MSTQHEHDDDRKLVPESSGIKAKPILTFMGILTVSTIVVFILIKVLLWAFDRIDRSTRIQPATQVTLPEGRRKLPPEPRLQGAPDNNGASLLPLEEMRIYRNQVNERAAQYGWSNKDAGVAHIPIDRAKDLIVERGLPTLSESMINNVQKAEQKRREILNAESNAGRSIKK